MKDPHCQSRDPDIIASFAALKRSAKAARKLSIQMGTPFYVWKDGKIVDLNRGRRKKGKGRRAKKQPGVGQCTKRESGHGPRG